MHVNNILKPTIPQELRILKSYDSSKITTPRVLRILINVRQLLPMQERESL